MVTEVELSEAILDLLASGADGATICPSEVARAIVTESDKDTGDEWRQLMDPVRRSARSLAHEGSIEITQRGKPVDPDNFKGPIRLKLK